MKKVKHLFLLFALLFSFLLAPVSALTDNSTGASSATSTLQSSVAAIKKRGKIVIGTAADYPPYEFSVKENGVSKRVGIDIDLGKQLAKDLGVKAEFKVMNFDSLLVALETHKVDVVIAAMSPTPERAKSVDFSQVYYGDNQDIVINKADQAKYKTLKDFDGRVIGAQNGSEQYDLAKQQMKGAKLKKNNTFDRVYIPRAGKYMSQGARQNTVWNYFVLGVGNTLLITIFAVFFGFLLGLLFALLRRSKNLLFHSIAVAYIEFIRGTPMMVQVMFVYFGIGELIQDIPAVVAGIIAISINSGAYVAEIIRSGVQAVNHGQTEAARSLGMSKQETMRYIIMPQALRNIWPALGNEFITLLKDSSIVSVIGVAELMYQTQLIQSATYKGALPLFIAMVIYFILTFTLTRLLNYGKRKLNRS